MEEQTGAAGFSDVSLVYNALPELDYASIDTSVSFLGKKLAAPILVNAMTGGHPAVKQINQSLARVAARFGLAMAVGSQTAALEDFMVRDSFTVVREDNPEGILLANLNARTPWPEVKKAIGMISADGVQLHLNVAHELAMSEGDRNFSGILANIEKIVFQSEVPVILKEVGFGLSREVVHRLYEAGVRYIDVGGKGGTDFIKIENVRVGQTSVDKWSHLGIPTAVSLLECLSLDLPVFFVATGGITSGTEVAAALALGGEMAGIAGHFLRILLKGSEEALGERVQQIIEELRQTMLICGAIDITALRQVPVIIGGKTGEWLLRRGVDINRYARR